MKLERIVIPRMTQKIILHIGPPKTGTSSLQEALYQHRDQLSAHGFDYPGFGRHPDMPKLPGHHGIPGKLRENGVVPQDVLDGLAALPESRQVVFSSENFSHVDAVGVRQLLETLGPENVEIIYYVRRWDQLLPSVWQELIKHGHSQTYLEFLNAQISAPMASLYLNYMNVLDRWAKVIGPHNIRIFSYDNIRAEGQDVVQHFCNQVLGFSLDVPKMRQDNKRQAVGRTETLRVLNRMVFGSKAGSARIRVALEQKQEQLQDELAALNAFYKPYTAQAPLCAPFVLRHVEQKFLKVYGSRVENLTADGTLFQDYTLEPSRYVRQDYLLQKGVLPHFEAILDVIGQG